MKVIQKIIISLSPKKHSNPNVQLHPTLPAVLRALGKGDELTVM